MTQKEKIRMEQRNKIVEKSKEIHAAIRNIERVGNRLDEDSGETRASRFLLGMDTAEDRTLRKETDLLRIELQCYKYVLTALAVSNTPTSNSIEVDGKEYRVSIDAI